LASVKGSSTPHLVSFRALSDIKIAPVNSKRKITPTTNPTPIKKQKISDLDREKYFDAVNSVYTINTTQNSTIRNYKGHENSKYTWEWIDDGGTWHLYEKSVCDAFEHAFNCLKSKKVLFYIPANGQSYEVIFAKVPAVTHHQYNVQTRTVHEVLRILKEPSVPFIRPTPITADEKRVSDMIEKSTFPLHWNPEEIKKGRYKGFTVNLSTTSSEYKQVESLMRHSHSSNTIVSIAKVVNPLLYLRYQHWADLLKFKLGSTPTEMYGFHGTSDKSKDEIIKTGFKYRFNQQHLWGRGNYFARDFSYCTHRNFTPPDKKKHRYVFVCRICVGRTRVGNSGMASADEMFDTATDRVVKKDINEASIFVTFHDDQSYPEYLITWK